MSWGTEVMGGEDGTKGTGAPPGASLEPGWLGSCRLAGKLDFSFKDSWSLQDAGSRRDRKNASVLAYSVPIYLALC